MREVTVKVYKYSELSDKAKEKARDWFLENAVFDYWYDSTYEDAKQIGIEITGFDIDRGSFCNIDLLNGYNKTALLIIEQHGECCDTYIAAKEFLLEYGKLELDSEGYVKDSEQKETIKETFHIALKNAYLSNLRKEYEYQTSEECIAEGMEANEYEFTENGKRL
jgi:hypothetical protein